MVGERILLVEDESIVALNICRRLEACQYQMVGIAESAATALHQVQAALPDLVLMDIRLKGEGDGIEAAHRIREQFDIPIVYLTAYAEAQILERAKVTEPYGYVLKPFEMVALQAAIELALHKHRVDLQVRERERLLSTTLHSIGDAVIVTDAQGSVTFMNAVAERLTGWTQAESLDCALEQVFRVVDERTGQAIANPVTQALQDRKVVGLSNHAILLSKTGVAIPIDDSAAPILNQRNEVQGAVLVFHDIIQRKQREMMLQQRNQELENQVQASLEELRQSGERFQQTLNEQFQREIEQRTLAREQELRDLRSRLITTASHELRTPLAVILTSGELLERVNSLWPAERRLNYIQRIQGAVRKLAHILNDLLTLQQTELGTLPFHPEAVALGKFCQDIVEEMQALTEHLQIQLQLPNSLPPTLALDPELLWLILTNLLTNAIKYSPQPGTIELRVRMQDSSTVRFYVRDRGIGIPPEDVPYLFESFHRGKNVSTLAGTGLGLAIAKRCVDLHGGEIAIASRLDEGTEVTVVLPTAQLPPVANPSEA